MRKILSLALVAVICFCIATIGFAEVQFNRGPDSRILTESRSGANTAVLSTSVTSKNRIFGFSCSDSAAGSCGIYDAASVAVVLADHGTYLIGDIYVAAGTVGTMMFPMPRDIVNGLVTSLQLATGAMTVYYE